jgi:hypothetical protein
VNNDRESPSATKLIEHEVYKLIDMNILETEKEDFMNACQEVLKVGKIANYQSAPDQKDKKNPPQTDAYGRVIDNGP